MKCPHCHNEDTKLMEKISPKRYLCSVCSKTFDAN